MSLATITAMLIMLSVPVASVTPEQMTAQSSYPASYSVSTSTVSVKTLNATSTPVVIKNGVKLSPEQQQIARELKAYYTEAPILTEIAFCESSYKHIDGEGNVIRGRVDSRDVGVMQINERYHLETAQKLGYDIHTIEGNMAYAKYLYDKQGTRPWSASEPCWGKYTETI